MTAAAALALALATLAAPGAGRAELRDELERIERALEAWDTAAARRATDRLLERLPESAEAHLADARVRFHEGRYADALAALAAAGRQSGAAALEEEIAALREFVAPLAALEPRFQVTASPHFRFHHAERADGVLVARGLEALESCAVRLAEDFGIRPDAPVRVEVFPDAASFQKASTLSRDEIETSGTIALCKFDRLMMLTPRTVIRGYAWADTLCHEYAHWVLWKRNGTTVPIWLHEGIAKHEEVRWSRPSGSELTPLMRQSLKQAVETGDFVTFEEMHPSFAKLDTPADVALASAEVLSILRALMAKGGYPLLLAMLDHLKAGADWREAFEKALGQPFEAFWKAWQEGLRSELAGIALPTRRGKLVELRDPMRPAGGGIEEAEGAAGGEGDDEPGRLSGRHARLGDILRERGHARAAAIEYDKAARARPQDSPLLWNRLGLAWQMAGEPERAREAFLAAERIDPEYAPTLTNLGLAEVRRGEPEAAIGWLERAVRVNPFDPRLHEALEDAYGAVGDAARRERARRERALLAGGGSDVTESTPERR